MLSSAAILLAALLVLISTSTPLGVAAQTLDQVPPLDQQASCDQLGIPCPANPTGVNIANFILKFINPLIILAATVFVAALVYGGAKYIISTGDEAEARKAKLVIIYATIGLLVIGLAGIAVNAFLNIFPPLI